MPPIALRRRCSRSALLVCCLALLGANASAVADDNTEDLYSTYCASCHGVKNAEAPEAFNAAVWKRRMEKGADTVLANAIKGVGNMPSQGTCFECTQGDLRKLIQYMSRAKVIRRP
jgi:cytochrome c5